MAYVVASTAVCDLLRDAPRPARVVAALPAAVYLEVPGRAGPVGRPRGPVGSAAGCAPRWVALLARDAVRVPVGLVTAVPRARRPFAAVTPGAHATIGDGSLELEISGVLHVYRPLRYWDPAVPRLGAALATVPVARRAEALALLATGLPPDDVRAWADRAVPLEAALAPAAPDAGRVAAAVAALVGLGPGLTPAGDDVVAGALVTLAAAADEPRRRVLADAVLAVLPRTTPVSAALLDQACRGRTVPQVADVLRALAGSGDLDAALARLARVGHTSGPALALGMRAALRARAARPLGRCA